MRGLRVWGVGTACLLGLGLAVGSRAGETPSGGGGKPSAVRPAGGATRQAAAEMVRATDGDAAPSRQRELNAYFRRIAVCDKLIQIAYQTNDLQLQELTEQLQQRAFDVYMQRVARSPGDAGDDTLDEQILGKAQSPFPKLGAGLENKGRGWFGTGPNENASRLPARRR